MFNIVLVHPRIPQNTGSIGRMCYNSGCALHIIKPTIFDLEAKHLKRAGLDYWDKLEPIIWDDLQDFLVNNIQFVDRFFFSTTKATKPYFEFNFLKNDFLFFGSESYGLPIELINLNPQNKILIPMKSYGRSLNLATSVGIITYEAIRQNYNNFKLD